MNLSKIFLTFLTLFTSVQFCFAQEKPKATLSDRFTKVYCEEILGRVDNFFIDLMKESDTAGYVVIYYGEGSIRERFVNENWIMGQAALRQFDLSRLQIASVDRGDKDVAIEFWRVPAGTDKPVIEAANIAQFKVPSKALVFGDTFGENCISFSNAWYVNYLKANSGYRAHIVVYNESLAKARKEGKQQIETFTQEHQISAGRLRVFYAKPSPYAGVEYWLVPVKKK